MKKKCILCGDEGIDPFTDDDGNTFCSEDCFEEWIEYEEEETDV